MFRLIKSLFTGASPKPKVVTRFAPSPTGLLHSGAYRTAIFSYLYARQNKGRFIMRIEDTDKARSTKENEANILDSVAWLGLNYDSISRQSDRTAIYKQYLEKLLKEDKIYISKEQPKADAERKIEEGRRTEVVRFRNPNRKVSFDDIIRGRIEFDTTELGDFVIAKSLEEPLFHFVVVLDDYLSGVTHVIRGEDHISNTPRHILIYEALGAKPPQYAHLPLVLAPDRSKLSKRHGAKPVTYYRDQGFLPEAVLNYICLLGWNPGTEEEIFTLEQLIEKFDLSRVQKAGAIFNEEKLKWFNKEHLKRVPAGVFAAELKSRLASSTRAKELAWQVSDEMVARLAPTVLERISTYAEIDALIESQDFDYYFSEPKYAAASLGWKGEKDLSGSAIRLKGALDIMKNIDEGKWNSISIKEALWPYAEKEGRGQVLWPLRFSLSGKEKSPDPFTLASILGKTETLRRIEIAITACEAHTNI
jgi:nondiscriminating glutamyl-tRNA synthetase